MPVTIVSHGTGSMFPWPLIEVTDDEGRSFDWLENGKLKLSRQHRIVKTQVNVLMNISKKKWTLRNKANLVNYLSRFSSSVVILLFLGQALMLLFLSKPVSSTGIYITDLTRCFTWMMARVPIGCTFAYTNRL